MGLGPVRRTNNQIKGVSRLNSNLIKLTGLNPESYIFLPIESEVRRLNLSATTRSRTKTSWWLLNEFSNHLSASCEWQSHYSPFTTNTSMVSKLRVSLSSIAHSLVPVHFHYRPQNVRAEQARRWLPMRRNLDGERGFRGK